MARRRPPARVPGDRELKLAVLAIGRCRDRHINHLCEEYLDRITRRLSAGLVEIEGRTDRAVLDRIRRASKGAHVIALSADGKALGSDEFARHLETLLADHSKIAFLVGGPEGFPPGTLDLVDERLSLSQMTLPHRLARLLLLEQIYRALSITSGEPYHR